MFHAEDLTAFVFPHMVQTGAFAGSDYPIAVSAASFTPVAQFIMTEFQTFRAGELSAPDPIFNTFTADVITGTLRACSSAHQNKDNGEYE